MPAKGEHWTRTRTGPTYQMTACPFTQVCNGRRQARAELSGAKGSGGLPSSHRGLLSLSERSVSPQRLRGIRCGRLLSVLLRGRGRSDQMT